MYGKDGFMSEAIPFFKTHHSIGKSILTVSDVFRIAQENSLKSVVIIEDMMMGFPEAVRLSKKTGIKLIYGVRFDVCNSLKDTKEEQESSTCKMIAVMKNDAGYKDLIKLFSTVHTSDTNRTDYQTIKEIWKSDNIDFGLPFYDSFVAKNCLCLSNCIPDFGDKVPFVCVEDNSHPFDSLIQGRIKKYCASSKNRIVFCKSIYYENKKDYDAYTVYRLICGRSVYGNSSLDKPNLPYFCSDRFCFEDWKNNKIWSFKSSSQQPFSLKDKRIVLFDTETEGLNLRTARPWQIAWVVMKNGKVIDKEMHYLAWEDLNVSKEAAKITGFDKKEYDKKKEDPKDVINKFWELIYEPDVVVAGQNILGFDIFILNVARREVGYLEDYGFLWKCIDTVSLSRAYLTDFRRSSSETVVEFCYKMLNHKLKGRVSVKLSVMLAKFGIKYEEDKLHDALVDTEMTGQLFLRLVRSLGLESEEDNGHSVPDVSQEQDFTNEFYSISEVYDTPMLEGVILPKANIVPEEAISLGLSPDCTSLKFLRKLCEDGMIKKGLDKSEKYEEYKKRLDYELEVLDACGFVDYMLLNREIIQFCNASQIPVGDGRGSAAGCLVFYLTGVTGIDPLENHLIFERFVSMARAQKRIGKNGETYLDGGLLADCDLDISFEDRPKVIDFVFKRFDGNACRILTVNTLSGKLCIKECMKLVGGYMEAQARHVADSIPKKYGVVRPLAEAYESSDYFQKFCDDNAKIYEISLKLENLNKNTGIHPSGVAICAFPLLETIPLQKTKDGELVSSFEMGDVAEVMTKFDLLGLRTLTQIKETCDMLGINHKDIDYRNPEIYKHINEYLMPRGLFQISSDTNYRVAQQVSPSNLDELSDVIALARPGALAYIQDYVKAKKTGEVRASGDDKMDSLLKETKGILLFQESLMNIAHKRFGFSLERADALRKCVSGDTRFLSKTRGWISIDELLEEGYKGDLFLVMDESGVKKWKEIRDIWSNGRKRIRTVIDEDGRYVHATRNHQFRVMKKYGKFDWVEAGSLFKKDYLVGTCDVPFVGKNTLSKDMCIILAGVMTNFSFSFYSKNARFFKVYTEALRGVYGSTMWSVLAGFGGDADVVLLEDKVKRSLETYVNIVQENKQDLPNVLFSQGKENLREFISFLFAYNGDFSNFEITYKSVSRKFLSSLQLLLSYFGIRASVSEEDKVSKCYILHISSTENRKYIKLFNENFAKYLEEEDNKYLSDCLKSFQEPLVDSEMLYYHLREVRCRDRIREVYDFTVDEETPFIVANGMVIHNCVGKKQVDKMPLFEKEIMDGAKANGVSQEAALYFWNVCQESANYSFNRCLDVETTYVNKEGEKVKLYDCKIGDCIESIDLETGKKIEVKILDMMSSERECYEVEFSNGKKLICSLSHKFPTSQGKMTLQEIMKRQEQGQDIQLYEE